MTAGRDKVCEICGVTFACHPGQCWCDDASPSAERRAQLRAAYNDCVCPACLQAPAASPRQAPEAPSR